MVWTVTLEIVDCASTSTKLAGASVFDSVNTWFTDANGQLIYVVDDSFVGVIVRINHGTTASAPNGYISKNYTIAVQNAGTIQTICLSAAPPSDPTGACFTGDALVTLADGSHKPISQICVGDYLLGRNSRLNRVSAIGLPRLGNQTLYSLNNSQPFVTGEHPFMTVGGWKTIELNERVITSYAPRISGRLQVNDQLLRLQGCAVAIGGVQGEEDLEVQLKHQTLRLLSNHHADPQTQLYNLQLEGDHTYFVNGWLVHNKTQGGCTFVVTAATGSGDSDEIVRLRQLRNQVAAQSTLADQLIELIYLDYFQFSPAIAAELEQDTLARKAVLWTVVRPLLAWYALAASLALEPQNRARAEEAAHNLREACPPELSDRQMTSVLQALCAGQALPAHSPELLQKIAPRIRQAASLKFASWAILDPLLRLWRTAGSPVDLIEETTQWLIAAPLDALTLSGDPEQASRNLSELARLFDFCPPARYQLGQRLASVWPHASAALTQAGFVRPYEPTDKEN